jgi:hypothetical protein
MDAFAANPPEWTDRAVHALTFCCPKCKATAAEAQEVWLNRRSPVSIGNSRKWQEFYWCQCDTVWWAWSSDRPPSTLSDRENPPLFW